jgi:hypothetical protein
MYYERCLHKRHIADFSDVRNVSYVGERFQIAKDSWTVTQTVTFTRKVIVMQSAGRVQLTTLPAFQSNWVSKLINI